MRKESESEDGIEAMFAESPESQARKSGSGQLKDRVSNVSG